MGEEGARILEHEVRELVRRRGLDPIGDRAGLSSLVTDAVGDYATRASVGVVPPLADPAAAAQAVTDAVGGFGPLQPYLDDPEIEEVWLNSPPQAAHHLLVPCAPGMGRTRSHQACGGCGLRARLNLRAS